MTGFLWCSVLTPLVLSFTGGLFPIESHEYEVFRFALSHHQEIPKLVPQVDVVKMGNSFSMTYACKYGFTGTYSVKSYVPIVKHVRSSPVLHSNCCSESFVKRPCQEKNADFTAMPVYQGIFLFVQCHYDSVTEWAIHVLNHIQQSWMCGHNSPFDRSESVESLIIMCGTPVNQGGQHADLID